MALATDKLTNNQQTVLDLLEQTKEPLKAYAILFDNQKKGIKSPLQVYRALDKLIEIGKVHKIESKNSYIACNNDNCSATTSTSFLICEICDQVTELKSTTMVPRITTVFVPEVHMLLFMEAALLMFSNSLVEKVVWPNVQFVGS